MSNYVNVSGTWKQALRQFVNVSSTWRIVNRTYVNANGTWKLCDVRTPGAPTSASITVNGSSSTTQTTTSSPMDVDLSWTVGTLDASLPQVVRWYVNSAQYGSPQDIAAGTTTATIAIPIASGESKVVAADIRIKNEDSSVPGSTVYSTQTSTSAISVSWPVPSLFSVQLSANYSADTFTISWQSSNVPTGYYYGVQWYDSQNNPIAVGAGVTTGLSRTIDRYYWGYDGHGYDLQEFAGDNVLTTFTATVFLYDTNNNLVSDGQGGYVSSSGSAAFYTGTGGGI